MTSDTDSTPVLGPDGVPLDSHHRHFPGITRGSGRRCPHCNKAIRWWQGGMRSSGRACKHPDCLDELFRKKAERAKAKRDAKAWEKMMLARVKKSKRELARWEKKIVLMRERAKAYEIVLSNAKKKGIRVIDEDPDVVVKCKDPDCGEIIAVGLHPDTNRRRNFCSFHQHPPHRLKVHPSSKKELADYPVEYIEDWNDRGERPIYDCSIRGCENKVASYRRGQTVKWESKMCNEHWDGPLGREYRVAKMRRDRASEEFLYTYECEVCNEAFSATISDIGETRRTYCETCVPAESIYQGKQLYERQMEHWLEWAWENCMHDRYYTAETENFMGNWSGNNAGNAGRRLRRAEGVEDERGLRRQMGVNQLKGEVKNLDGNLYVRRPYSRRGQRVIACWTLFGDWKEIINRRDAPAEVLTQGVSGRSTCLVPPESAIPEFKEMLDFMERQGQHPPGTDMRRGS